MKSQTVEIKVFLTFSPDNGRIRIGSVPIMRIRIRILDAQKDSDSDPKHST
jgi:hypothetical protein